MLKRVIPLALLVSAAWPVAASDYGCTVLLCLANPGGPREYAECRPDIDRLFRDLRDLKPFPTCNMEGGNDGSSYAQLVRDPYDPCPVGTAPAPKNINILQGVRKPGGKGWGSLAAMGYTVTGTPKMSEAGTYNAGGNFGNDWTRLGARACVANLQGTYQFDYNNKASIYETVVWQQPQNPRAIDVYIDWNWHNRVRY